MKNLLPILFAILVSFIAFTSQNVFSMNLNDTFNLMTTLVITTTDKGQTQGTAFFYQHLGPKTKEGPQWRNITNTWLVTNRHVIYPKIKNKEIFPLIFTYHMRKIVKDKLIWVPFVLSANELKDRVKVHVDDKVDIAIIDIHDKRLELAKDKSSKYAQTYAVNPEMFAGEDNIIVEASDDILVVGYPRGFYDDVNLYPIIKSGIIASRWGAQFGGNPYFLIDAKLFPGSSGSIVVSKPTNTMVKEGKMLFSKEKQFAFLGIYSGEPFKQENPVDLEDMVIIQKSRFDVGIVWYANLIDEIIDKGKKIN